MLTNEFEVLTRLDPLGQTFQWVTNKIRKVLIHLDFVLRVQLSATERVLSGFLLAKRHRFSVCSQRWSTVRWGPETRAQASYWLHSYWLLTALIGSSKSKTFSPLETNICYLYVLITTLILTTLFQNSINSLKMIWILSGNSGENLIWTK